MFHGAVTATAARIRADAPLRIAYLDNPLASGNCQLISTDGHWSATAKTPLAA